MWKRTQTVAQAEGSTESVPRRTGIRSVRKAPARGVRQSLPRDVRQSLPRDVRQSLPRDVRQSLPRGVRKAAPRAPAPEDPETLVQEIRILDALLRDRSAEVAKLKKDVAAHRQMDLELFELAPVAYATLDRAGTILAGNFALSKLLGVPRSRIVGSRLARYTADRDAAALTEAVRQAVGGDEKTTRTITFRRAEGGPLQVRVEIVGVGLEPDRRAHVALIDDTERHHLARELRRAGKLNEVGLAASAIAHDFNNVLLGIVGCADLALEHLSTADGARSFVQELKAVALRGSMLTGKLLALDRSREAEPPRVDMNEVVSRTEALLRGLLGDRLRLHLRTARAPVVVRIDPIEIEQILLNLATNARRAMREGGNLSVEVATTELPRQEMERRRKTGPRQFAVLKVADDGPGMNAATRSRAFEPFFTTSSSGVGTGLGLATVREIIVRGGGLLDLWTEPGHGTTIRILFPLEQGESTSVPGGIVPVTAAAEALTDGAPERPTGSDEKVELDAKTGPEKKVGHSATVLLLEDDEASRGALATFLERRGYRVLVAENGAEARRLCREHPGAVEIIVSDLGLEDGSGVKLAAAARATHRDAVVVFISGRASGDPLVKQALRGARTTFLRKPFELDDLLRAMETLRGGVEP